MTCFKCLSVIVAYIWNNRSCAISLTIEKLLTVHYLFFFPFKTCPTLFVFYKMYTSVCISDHDLPASLKFKLLLLASHGISSYSYGANEGHPKRRKVKGRGLDIQTDS